MIRVIRSEIVRIVRPRFLLGWFSLMAIFSVMVNAIMFSEATGTTQAPSGPGVAFPSAAELASPSGVVAGLSAAASMFGVVTLAFWAITAGTDSQSGLIRLLASTERRRWKLITGKAVALAIMTAVATTVALMVSTIVAPAAAKSADISTALWGTDSSVMLTAWVNAYLAMLVWGAIGLALATILRSSAIAISLGIGWVLVVESIVGLALDDPSWLPGSTMQSLAAGGNAAASYGSALGLGSMYICIAMTLATVVMQRRDITD
jgi:ABC-type transport system involved in multi-copper enzyme maturation permease subunit